jgi:lambda repressor-like predicted transcriptional regulator
MFADMDSPLRERVLRLLAVKGSTIAWLSRESGIDYSALQKSLNGSRGLPAEELARIVVVLKSLDPAVSADSLLGVSSDSSVTAPHREEAGTP